MSDPPSFEEIYREHFDFVYRIAARFGGSWVDPEDIAQEVFLVVDRRLHTFDGTAQISTWLYGIVVNVVRAARRAARRRWRYAADEAEGLEVAARDLDAVEVREAHQIAEHVLDKLSPKKREAFILAEFEGLSCEEIAQLTDAKTETVWSRLHYARKEFAERLEVHTKKGGRR